VLPLKDNIPTDRLPIVTILFIVINLGVFIWQLTFPSDKASSPELAQAGLSERDEVNVEYGAIPYRITHPGNGCAVTAVPSGGQLRGPEIVCEGTKEYEAAKRGGAENGGQVPFAGLDEAPWLVTLFTSMFMHGGILHIAGNMLFLWVFGNNIEDSMGRLKFILFYLLAGLVAVYSQAALDVDSTVPTIGASGAVAGVLGAYALLHPGARVLTLIFIIFFVTLVEIPAMILLGIWFVLQFLPAVGQVATPEVGGGEGVAYLAHVGGFLFGLAAIKLFAQRRREAERPFPVY
jgi:membrane associated rhomboid family serine protease